MRLRIHACAGFVVALILSAVAASAQDLPNLTPDQLQRLEAAQRQSGGAGNQQQPSKPLTLTPGPQPRGELGTSQLETIMSDRTGQTLRQFGYDQVGVGANVIVPQMGAVQDDYVLGPGDVLDVSLRGQENSSYKVIVDRNGQVTLPRLSPISAAGRTLGELRDDLVAAVHRAYVSTEAFVSVDQLRQVSVLVSGEVANPGTRIVTGLSSPLDAILLSGGIRKTGSLRNIELIRDGRVTTIDLYGVLTRAAQTPLINLRDGDRILVPPIGATVAVAGFVRRPAIYELPHGQEAISARESIALAAGPAVPGAHTVSIMRLMPDGKLQFVDVTNQLAAVVHDSEAVVVRSSVNVALGRVTLAGAVRSPGAFALDRYPTLHDLIPTVDALGPGAYLLMGVIDRINPKTMQREALAFSPLHVIHGSENVTLVSNDTVRILTDTDMCQILVAGIINETRRRQASSQFGGVTATASTIADMMPPNCASIAAPTPPAATSTSRPSPLTAGGEQSTGAASRGATATKTETGAAGMGAADETGVTTAAASSVRSSAIPATAESSASFANGAAGSAAEGGLSASDRSFFGPELTDYRVSIAGAVHQPGTYLVAPDTTLAEALIGAGGLAQDVDLSSFELTSTILDNATGAATTNREKFSATPDQLARVVLRPLDSVIFRHVYSNNTGGTVRIAGEVRYPGTYDILRGERLSSLLMRAGGLTEVAYPYGTVFLRQSVARREEEGNRREIDDIRSQLVVAMVRPTGSNAAPLSPETAAALQGLLREFESQPALGRISVIADPAVLAARPNRDPILEPGDSVTIPKRPSTVTVLGQVMQPGSFPFDSSLSTSDYVERAGGFSQFADSSRVVVVLPDGTARLSERSWLGFGGGGAIPPGSVIVVPRDLESVSIHQLIVDTTQILSQLATTAAALAVLSKY